MGIERLSEEQLKARVSQYDYFIMLKNINDVGAVATTLTWLGVTAYWVLTGKSIAEKALRLAGGVMGLTVTLGAQFALSQKFYDEYRQLEGELIRESSKAPYNRFAKTQP